MFWLRMGVSVLGFGAMLIPVGLLLRLAGFLFFETTYPPALHLLAGISAVVAAGVLLVFAINRVGDFGE